MSQVEDIPNNVFETYGDPHRMFVQSMMNRCIITATEFNQLFEMICKNCNIHLDNYNKSTYQKTLIMTCNTVLDNKCNMKIIKVGDEEYAKIISSLILVNRTDRSKDTTKLTIRDQVTFAPHELEFLKLILDEIMENPMRQIKSTKALNLCKNLDKSIKKIQPHEAEMILQKLKSNKWLVENSGILILSTRFIYEMEPFLREVYVDYINNCSLCRKIVIRCIVCPNEDCDSKYHMYCAKGVDKCNSRCKNCKTPLPDRFQGVGNRVQIPEPGSPEQSQYQSQSGGQKRKRIQQMESDSESD